MFGLHPSAPTHPEDYAIHSAGRPLRNTRVRPRGLTPRRLAQRRSRGFANRQVVRPDLPANEPGRSSPIRADRDGA